MKRLRIVLFATCCAVLTPLFAQTNKKNVRKSNPASTHTAAPKKTQAGKRTRAIPLPAAGIFSVQELENQRKKTLEDIALTSRLLGATNADANHSLNRLKLLSQQLLSRKKLLTLLEQELAAIDTKIKTMNDDIDILDKDLTKAKENYAKAMQNQQQEHRTAQYKLLLVLSAGNLSQSYRRIRFLHEYSKWQKEEAGRIINKQNELAARNAELEKTRNDKQELLTQREQENKHLEAEEQLQQKEVRELKKKQKELQTQLQQKKKEADALHKQIEALITEDMANSRKTG